MCKVQMLRALVKQRLTAAAEEIFVLFERTIAEYEEELCRSKEENERQRKLLDAVLKPQLRLHRADVQQLLLVREEVPPEQQEWSSSLDQEDPEPPPHIKEEQEELWISQEVEQLQGLEEADITKFTFTPVPVKSEDDEEKPQSSELQRQTEHMETGAGGGHCGGPEPARNSDPETHLQPDTEDKTGDSSDTDDSEDWKETREPLSGLSSLGNEEVPISSAGEKPFSCSECGKRFGNKRNLNRHILTHTGEKPFSCSVCKKSFTQSGSLQIHMRIHTGEKPFSCSICNKRFAGRRQVIKHKCDFPQSSQLHQTQTEENREAGPPASSSTEHMETGANGEDCGGPEPAGNSDPERHLHTDTEDKTGDSSDTENWKKIRIPQSGLNSLGNEEVPVSNSRSSAGEKPFSCSQCGKTFGARGTLNRHVRIHTGEKEFSCSVCKKSFSQKANLQKHMKIHKGENPFSCSVCKESFPQRANLQKHKKIHKGEKPFSCSVCKKSFSQRGILQNHMRTHTGEKPFSCSLCDRRFSVKAHLRLHMRTHTGEKPFSCSVCDKRFARPCQIKIHKCVGLQSSQLHHTQTEENREAEPPASSSTEHTETHSRSSAGEKLFSCSQCGKRFVLKGNLKLHMITHTGEKPYSCSVCMKSFTQKSNLQTHMRTHTGEKSFSCSVCDARFSCKGNLIPHMRIHTGEKPNICSVCGRGFSHKVDLKSHILTHTGTKPFRCSVCEKSFTQSDGLKGHMRIHTGEKPFSCSVCNKRFTWRRHVKTHECDVPQSSQLHQTQTEESREAEPLASSSTEHMETGADAEDCGGPEPAVKLNEFLQ
ncbi:zinc finger protein 271-like [Cottoperca gobio]|uniref:Zinc finger protein 271-like n=1 Tax=Cottoperca gobio TaxID=56716 RepID=A0A6J2PGK2_COTGO|nr:zinc finger protein 271-like [Cottoperca gobio]